MRTLKIFFGLVVASLLFVSCSYDGDSYYDENQISLEEVITNYDIWYVDFNRTTGYGDVPFVSKAFTLTFQNGRMYANNNIVGLGFGNLYGIQTGTYHIYGDILKLQHSSEGTYNFEVIVDNLNSIRLYNSYEDVTYYLEGYDSDTFDFDQIFYDNIEYFLQEYEVWTKTYTSLEGDLNDFDYENFLAFTPEDITTFYSSVDEITVPLDEIIWDFEGDYEVFDINGSDTIKELKLYYRGEENGIVEEFEMTILDDATIELYHYSSGTTYEFEGNGYIQYKNQGKTTEIDSEQGRKRFKVERKTVERKLHKIHPKMKESKQNTKPNRGRKQ